MDAAEYKHVVLGLIFLKYISDAFEERHAKLDAERKEGADPEDPDIVNPGSGSAGMVLTEAAKARDDAQTAFENELYKVPEVDETQIAASWDSVLKSTTENAQEMDSFFSEMFGDANDIFNSGGTAGTSTTGTTTGTTTGQTT